jgi:hypothetical protein
MKTTTKTKTPTLINEVVKVKAPVRTTYISKWERYVINTAIDYWMKNATKSELEELVIDRFKDVQVKFNKSGQV